MSLFYGSKDHDDPYPEIDAPAPAQKSTQVII